jgi:hypothetical protein
MILVGQYDSPYSRRVAISLMVLGIPYEHDTRSVFGDFDSMRTTNRWGASPRSFSMTARRWSIPPRSSTGSTRAWGRSAR